MTPVLVGSATAFAAGHFHPGLFAAALAASVAIHAGANLTNDYYDDLRGADTQDSIGPSGVIQRGLLAPRVVLHGALTLFVFSAILGGVLIASRGWPIVLIGAASIAAGYAYTGRPLPLGYVGLGDIVVFVFMGLVATIGAYFVQAGTSSAVAIWAALPIAALVDAILVVNNLRDLDTDQARGKRTFATFIGRTATRAHFLIVVGGAYLIIAVGVWRHVLPLLALFSATTIPSALRIWTVVRTETDPRTLTRDGLRPTAQLHQWVGVVLALAFVLTRLF
jgi:1,4-dihydroxy-2-naphthoate octaprenyltransferase